jgi:hypothetical protein
MKNVFIVLSVIVCFSLNAFAADYASHSVLSGGKWIQLKVTDNAVYKLTYDDIKKMGFNDPSKIKLYGYGGWILDQDFTKPYVDDLPEVAVYIHKGSDNVFGAGDYLLFYGRGSVKWIYDAQGDFFAHENNPYSLYGGSYFITENEQGPKELPLQNSYTQAQETVTTFDDYRVHEKDETAVLHSGRELFGESFISKTSQNFAFTIPGITNDSGKVRLFFIAGTRNTASVSLSIDNQPLLNLPVGIMSSDGYEKAVKAEGTAVWKENKSENVTVNVSYNAPTSTAYLNYISLNMKRQLRAYNEAYTLFRNKASRNTALNYAIENTSANHQVWNITNIADIQRVQTSLSGTTLHFGANTDGLVSEYVMVDVNAANFPVPQVTGEIKNQNLHSLPPTDMVIIAPETYFSLAETLAEKHRTVQGLQVTVVQPEWIYNEFSSGTPDATAYRRFMKMFYDRAANENEKPKYLLLFGDGYFNNRVINPKNYLLTYQFPESLNEIRSYGTDDYFGFLDDTEGLNPGTDKLDLGIGRFTVNTYEQAENTTNKVISYMENTNYGAWKNRVIFTADDTGDDAFCSFAKDAEELAGIVEKNHPEYMVTKSYMDAFQPVDANGKRTYPDAKKKLLETLQQGCFLMNYTGHGGPTAMSGEDMMNIANIRQMKFESLPLWITATCDFGRFDDDATSAGEEVFLNKKSAGIALFATTRVVYGYQNQVLNRLLVRNIFAKNADGTRPALGDIMRQSKLSYGTDNNKLNFMLIGDPALILDYPEWEVVLESINDQPAEGGDTIHVRALEEMLLKGVIKDGNGTPVDDYAGSVDVTIFDAQRTIRSVTLDSSGNPWTFPDFPNVVYKGSSAVENGRFSVLFRVPWDISYTTDRTGKMSFYASDKNKQKDASGSFMNYALYGTADDVDWNAVGPEIKQLFLNTSSFQNGDDVNETPYFYADVFDADGINRTGSGVGHDILISIDNKEAWTYSLNNYFQPGATDGSGSVGFSIPELPAGKHELVFRVWDILNNSSTDTLRFNVVAGLKPEIHVVTASPNPAGERVEFRLEHNRPESVLEVEIRVYDITGRSIWTYTETGASAYLQSYPVEWNLRTGTGNRIQPGIYVYQAIVKTMNGKDATKSKKLIVL